MDIRPVLSLRTLPAGLAIIAAIALATAYTAQYVFGLQPCILCLYQRVPYWIIIPLGLVAFVMWPRIGRRLLVLCGLILLANAGIAMFHVGVEQHWWGATPSCSGTAGGIADIADLAQALSRPAPAACDEPQWSLFGITFAGYNVILCLGLGIGTLLAVNRTANTVSGRFRTVR